MLAQAGFFPEQVSTETVVDNFLYIFAAAAVVLVVGGLILIDLGVVKRKNMLDTAVQRIVGFMVGTLSYLFIGYAIWIWQFNSASPFRIRLGRRSRTGG